MCCNLYEKTKLILDRKRYMPFTANLKEKMYLARSASVHKCTIRATASTLRTRTAHNLTLPLAAAESGHPRRPIS